MAGDFADVFAELKPVLAQYERSLAVKEETPAEYTLYTKSPSPFPQHKGQALFFGQLRVGKAYVSFHLLPLYMNPALTNGMSQALKKRMQGKACFNFKTSPDPALITELSRLTAAAFKHWEEKKWL